MHPFILCLLFVGHNCQCSVITPASVPRNYSWQCLGGNMGHQGLNPDLVTVFILWSLLYPFKSTVHMGVESLKAWFIRGWRDERQGRMPCLACSWPGYLAPHMGPYKATEVIPKHRARNKPWVQLSMSPQTEKKCDSYYSMTPFLGFPTKSEDSFWVGLCLTSLLHTAHSPAHSSTELWSVKV